MVLKLNIRIVVVFITLSCIVGCAIFTNSNKAQQHLTHLSVFDQYGTDFRQFQQQAKTFSENVERLVNRGDSEALKKEVKALRHAYKEVEFIFDYTEPEYTYLYINGGPLPKLHKEVSEIDIIPPNGLQRLDEWVYEGLDEEDKVPFVEMVNNLHRSIAFIAESHLFDTLSAQQTFEALRSGVVRIFTLGLTGFDTPGSGDGINESVTSLQAMQRAFLVYNQELNNTQLPLYNDILSLFDKGIVDLEKGTSFETFDRLQFLKQIINPLYKRLFLFQQALGIPQTPLNRHAQNYQATNLFQEDFLDIGFYSQFNYSDFQDPDAIRLGKTLFYDPILSRNLDLSCASCHDPFKGFSDGLPKSITNQNTIHTKRNSPTLLDAAYATKYFWDLREHDLENQVAHVVEDALEFDIGFVEISKRLHQSKTYRKMFEDAYGGIATTTIHRRSISHAIASYVNTLTSFNSPFDQYVRGERTELDASVKSGFNLFMGKAACGTCHFAPVFNGTVPPFYIETESEVLGVTLGYSPDNPVMDNDPGRMANGRKGDAHPHFKNSFKTVTVRNAGITGPYMHNGTFQTLDQVIEFYDVGGGAGLGLEVGHQTLSSTPLNLSEKEKQDLLAFMHALTDTTGLMPGPIVLPLFEDQPYWNERGRPKVID